MFSGGFSGSTFVIFSLEVCLACRLSELDIRCCKAIGFYSSDCSCSSDCVLTVFLLGMTIQVAKRSIPPTQDIENTPNFEERLQDLMESLNEGIVSAAEVQGGRKRGSCLLVFCGERYFKKHMYSHMYLQVSWVGLPRQ